MPVIGNGNAEFNNLQREPNIANEEVKGVKDNL